MRRIPLITPLLLLTVMLLPAQARIGETLEQCKGRYGPVIERRAPLMTQSDPEACVFSKDGISIIIEFRAGIAWNIKYRTLDLVPTQVNTLLKANMPEGGTWSAAYIVAEVQYRLSGDRRRTASYYPGQAGEMGILEISSREFNAARWEERSKHFGDVIKAAAEKKKLDGF